MKRANQQITVLTQRVARYEMEKGIAGKGSPSQYQGRSDEEIDEYGDEGFAQDHDD